MDLTGLLNRAWLLFSNSGTIKFPCQKHEVFVRNRVCWVSPNHILVLPPGWGPGAVLEPHPRCQGSPSASRTLPGHGTQTGQQHIGDPGVEGGLASEPAGSLHGSGLYCGVVLYGSALYCIITSTFNPKMQSQLSAAAAAWEGRHSQLGCRRSTGFGQAYMSLRQSIAGFYINYWELHLWEGLE